MADVWRQAGISYLRYANLCALYTRQALKPAVATAARVRDGHDFKLAKWAEGQRLTPFSAVFTKEDIGKDEA
eukprot:CAMPEP_0175808910 /NCGR_PEP_ID=MMETSP0107_2-20121207/2513_1 /TAXON_ID=195067 ORGANISM="Goniomonas pacifica, Strain CCMP1869" /NCGR_SAMPLE_ID=MMETSP0107_2 /ASSEMBLY_ACC=CAM_ASM_000203 /LENGTH=71 /DNA_ID=CAMNT_0017120573 /DNA_START=19 /DNA_END=234 /DNA_ORIENTATION=-